MIFLALFKVFLYFSISSSLAFFASSKAEFSEAEGKKQSVSQSHTHTYTEHSDFMTKRSITMQKYYFTPLQTTPIMTS